VGNQGVAELGGVHLVLTFGVDGGQLGDAVGLLGLQGAAGARDAFRQGGDFNLVGAGGVEPG
jgi:hypothetical protein